MSGELLLILTCVGLGILSGLAWLVRRVHRLRDPRYCLRCRYDLFGDQPPRLASRKEKDPPPPICPECGYQRGQRRGLVHWLPRGQAIPMAMVTAWTWLWVAACVALGSAMQQSEHEEAWVLQSLKQQPGFKATFARTPYLWGLRDEEVPKVLRPHVQRITQLHLHPGEQKLWPGMPGVERLSGSDEKKADPKADPEADPEANAASKTPAKQASPISLAWVTRLPLLHHLDVKIDQPFTIAGPTLDPRNASFMFNAGSDAKGVIRWLAQSPHLIVLDVDTTIDVDLSPLPVEDIENVSLVVRSNRLSKRNTAWLGRCKNLTHFRVTGYTERSQLNSVNAMYLWASRVNPKTRGLLPFIANPHAQPWKLTIQEWETPFDAAWVHEIASWLDLAELEMTTVHRPILKGLSKKSMRWLNISSGEPLSSDAMAWVQSCQNLQSLKISHPGPVDLTGFKTRKLTHLAIHCEPALSDASLDWVEQQGGLDYLHITSDMPFEGATRWRRLKRLEMLTIVRPWQDDQDNPRFHAEAREDSIEPDLFTIVHIDKNSLDATFPWHKLATTETLLLRDCPLKPGTLKAIVKSCTKLKWLGLRGRALTDATVSEFLSLKPMPGLVIEENADASIMKRVTDAGIVLSKVWSLGQD